MKVSQIRSYIFSSNVLDYLIVLAVGLGLLVFFGLRSFPKLSWSDEFVYAVMGRNVATGRGVISNFYYPRSIIEKGYPLGDVHMPGHSLILGFSFWLLGETDKAAFLPSYASYLVCGILLFWMGKNLFNRWVGFGTALAFYTFPSIVSYTNTASSDITLVLLSAIFLGVWYKSLQTPGWGYGILLAVALIAGMLHRETFLIFLPLALYALWYWPKPDRLKVNLYFVITFVLLLCIFFLPFYWARAPYPHFLTHIIIAPEPLSALTEMLYVNFRTFQGLVRIELSWLLLPFQLHIGLAIVVAASYLKFTGIQKKVWVYTIYSLAANIIALMPIYPITHRVFMYLLPSMLLLLVGLIGKLRPAWLKYGVASILICVLLGAALVTNDGMSRARQRDLREETIGSEVIARNSDRFLPQVVFTEQIFLYGWTHYPVTVIWIPRNDSLDLTTAQKLLDVTPVDVISVQNPVTRDRIYAASQEKLLPSNYTLMGEDAGYYIFVDSALTQTE